MKVLQELDASDLLQLVAEYLIINNVTVLLWAVALVMIEA